MVGVRDDDEVLMMTARGKIQRIVAGEISVIGRNTQGVRIMSLDEGDTLAAIVRVPRDEDRQATAAAEAPPRSQAAEPGPRRPAASPTGEVATEADDVAESSRLADRQRALGFAHEPQC